MKTENLRRWLTDKRVLAGLWLLLGVVSALTKMSSTRHNNFDIFRYVFYHTMERTSLYASSSDGGYWDVNHYGPFFSLIIAPFAVCPVWLGLVLWNTALAMFLYWAIRKSDFAWRQQVFILWFCAHELLTALFMQQFNVAIAAIIVLSYFFVARQKEWAATLFVVVGTLVKLYGVVGLAFFFFARNKIKYVAWLVVWTVVLVCLPMLLTGPEYQLQQYQEWFTCLVEKNGENVDSIAQNISLLGLVHRTTGCWFSDLWLIVPGLVLFCLPYLRVKQYANAAFQWMFLASTLMFVCLFSTGTESSGYIIALTGCAIWYIAVPWQRNRWDLALMVLAFVLTSLSPSDLFPRYLRQEWVQPYALKALPVALIWFKMCAEMLMCDYASKSQSRVDKCGKSAFFL